MRDLLDLINKKGDTYQSKSKVTAEFKQSIGVGDSKDSKTRRIGNNKGRKTH